VFCRSNLFREPRLVSLEKNEKETAPNQMTMGKQHRHEYENDHHLWWFRLSKVLCMVIAGAHLFACPYSKVEESFHVQATHDLYYYGVQDAVNAFYFSTSDNDDTTTSSSRSLPPYDHWDYPGVVPRTFFGSFLLAQACRIVGCFVPSSLTQPLQVILLARLLLLLLSLSQLFNLADALQQQNTKNGSSRMIGTYFLLIAAVQFHGMFYASRLLSNTFATIFTTRSLAYWVRSLATTTTKARSKQSTTTNLQMIGAAADMVLATAIFRCDCLLLLFCCGLSWLATRRLTVPIAIITGIVAGALGLAVTVPLDSALWRRRYYWPEGMVLYYNTILNKSSDYGVSAWHWYWSHALPKALLFTYVQLASNV
jgi:alpha-1,6-mannosyltransferase